MLKYDVIIIGAGLGGLLCGAILSKEGYNVCILEKNNQLGGCLQTFTRNNCIFNTSVSLIDGLSEGQSLYKYFKFVGLIDKLKLKRMDIDGFDIITFENKEYKYAQGTENFIAGLLKDFPDEEDALRSYVAKMEYICDQFPLYTLSDGNPLLDANIFSESAFEYIKSITNNRILQNVLAGTNMLYAGDSDKTPLYVHSLIVNSYISSSWRLIDGSSQIPDILAEIIRSNGGVILKNSEVKELVFDENALKYTQLVNGEKIEADNFISNIHPVPTLQMIDEKYFRKAYRNRINELENTLGVFTLYIVFKEDTFKYMNHNHYVFNDGSVWTVSTYNEHKWPQCYMLYTPPNSKSETWADSMVVMTYMKYEELKEWENTTVEKRGSDYIRFKTRKAELLLDQIELKFPSIRSNIKKYYTSTPLTNRDYTGTVNGSVYGIMKNYNDTFKTIISPKTKIPNLFFYRTEP